MHALLQAASSQAPMDAMHRLWAYFMLGVTGIVTEEATPLIGGLAAHDQRLRLSAVAAWVTGGTWVADLGLYYVGWSRGEWATRRFPRLRKYMLRAFDVVRRHPWRSSLAVRWGYGLRLTLPVVCGAARVPLGIYVIGSGISCVTWSVFFTILGWAFGRTTLLVLGHVRRYENYLVGSIVLGLVIGFWLIRKRHVDDEVVEVLAAGDTPPSPLASAPADPPTL